MKSNNELLKIANEMVGVLEKHEDLDLQDYLKIKTAFDDTITTLIKESAKAGLKR